MQDEHTNEQINNDPAGPERWHPDLPVYGAGAAAGSGRNQGGAADGSGDASSVMDKAPGADSTQEGSRPAPSTGRPGSKTPREDSVRRGAVSAQEDWTSVSDRIIQQSAKEIRDDAPTQEELRRRKERNEQRRARIEAAREREEKRYHRTRIELYVIIGLLVAGIAACGALAYVLYTEPEIEFVVLDINWEKITEPVTETVEEIVEAVSGETSGEEETVEEEDTVEGVTYVGIFELPVEGATGYSPVAMNVTDEDGGKVASLDAGEAFVILDTDGEYFTIETGDGVSGFVPTSCTWINLPDVIPSIIYYDVNADSSIFRSSGYNLPGITGEQLYTSRYMNERFGEEEYCMPVLYSMAVKIMQIQQACLKNGQSLKIYQTFRPYETQMAVASALQSLESSNSEVYEGLNSGSWSDTWFIATKLSNHQRGCAIDVSLVQVDETQLRVCAGYLYTEITEYTEYAMPSDMHELSYRAAVYDPPVSSSNDTAWRTATYADTMTTYAYQLQDYCTTYGLSPLSSEWWHFNDLEAKSAAGSSIGTGNFYLTECLSREPTAAEAASEDGAQE